MCAQGTPSRGKASTSRDNNGKAALDDCLERIRSVTEDAANFHFELTHQPSGAASQAALSSYPANETKWLRELWGAVTDYVGRIRYHYGDSVRTRSEVEKNWSTLEAEWQRWTDAVCQILQHAARRACAGLQGAELSNVAGEADRAIRVTRARLNADFAAAKRRALNKFAALEHIEKKREMSRFFDGAKLTDKQREVASLAWEYGLPVPEIARRLGKHRKTVDELLTVAQKKID